MNKLGKSKKRRKSLKNNMGAQSKEQEAVKESANSIIKKLNPSTEEINNDLVEASPGVQDGLDIELKDLYAYNAKYTPEEKIQAVMSYVLTGTSRKASRLCNVPEGTIRWWKSNAVWWDDVTRECRKHKQDELDARYTALIHKVVDGIENRVNNGDTVIDKDGNSHLKPIPGKDLAVIHAILFDKRQLLRGDVTSRTETTSSMEHLKKLGEKFEEMFNSVQKVRVIEGEVVDDGKK